MGCGWGVSKAGNLTKYVYPQGAVEWRVPIVWEMNRMMLKARSVLLHQIGLWMGGVAEVGAFTKYVHPQEAVERRVPIIWGNRCRADQEDDEWQTNIAY